MTTMKKIISASRRTDLPACHYEWFQNTLQNEYAEICNPRFKEIKYRVTLSPDSVHSMVLWSKDFRNVLHNPKYLENYNLYFQYTINNYAKTLEPFAPSYRESIGTLEGMLDKYRPEQFNIRFDPIVISVCGETQPTPEAPAKARLNVFEGLCRDLAGLGMRGCRITTSYLAIYRNVRRNMNMANIDIIHPNPDEQKAMAKELAAIALHYGFALYSCACPLLSEVEGVETGSCIDGLLLQELFGGKVSKARDTGQRKFCNCTKSSDIGSYDRVCRFKCVYCYAAGG